MCSSIFGPVMDNNYHQGDLTDIFRASGGGSGGSYGTSSSTSELPPHDLSSSSDTWQQQHHHMNFSSVMEDPIRAINVFGDPFSNMRDPFLHDLDLPPASSYFSTTATTNMEEASPGFVGSVVLSQKLLEDDMGIRPPACNNTTTNNIFSNMIQISPSSINAKLPVSPCDSPPVNMAAAVNSSSSSLSPRGIEPSSSAVVSAGNMNITVDNAGVQISSPRNPVLKRRKSQAKKVVCIPAPAAANSRPSSGEVVPSDLWAWRKYGQKPIKGSPYPRGYYRCSSSKGCSARKQVERSRTDPNMLVITYTSEHNHPWPTQRNALAGSTRSQPSKNNNYNNNAASKNNSEALIQPQNGMSSKPKEEDQQDRSNSDVSKKGTFVKEEMEMEDGEKHDELENIMEDNNEEFSDGLPYKPSMLEGNQSEDFFAELGEIEADPLNLLFTQGFNNEQQQRESKALDPFHLFDWSSGDHNTNTNTTTSFEEPKRGL